MFCISHTEDSLNEAPMQLNNWKSFPIPNTPAHPILEYPFGSPNTLQSIRRFIFYRNHGYFSWVLNINLQTFPISRNCNYIIHTRGFVSRAEAFKLHLQQRGTSCWIEFEGFFSTTK
ncbi:uncharacterized protein LOC108470840 [Gossypium arboreum]|uniref:uncharacterized protein LOC108470840 n=1 Tax=Gossypium arboreum TaxID=29729 RepID=UPI0008192796|nr:uncharacterized protein LOC108470840 [Gossypium arboreum]